MVSHDPEANARAQAMGIPFWHAPLCHIEGAVSCLAFVDNDGPKPNHVCLDTLLESTAEYVKRNYLTASHTAEAWAVAWPLPVGQQRMLDWVKQQNAWHEMRASLDIGPVAEYLATQSGFERDTAVFAAELRASGWRALTTAERANLADVRVSELPTPLVHDIDDAQAGLIIERRVDGGRIVLLGLVRDANPAPAFSAVAGGPLTFIDPVTLIEQHGADTAVFGVARDLTEWYHDTLSGRFVASHHDNGRRFFRTWDELKTALWRAMLIQEDGVVGQEYCAGLVGLSRKAFWETLGRFDPPMKWEDVRRALQLDFPGRFIRDR